MNKVGRQKQIAPERRRERSCTHPNCAQRSGAVQQKRERADDRSEFILADLSKKDADGGKGKEHV